MIWLTQAESSSAHEYVVNFAVHIALCEAARLDLNNSDAKTHLDEEGQTSLVIYLSCSCYATQWFSKAAFKDSFRLPSMFITSSQRSSSYLIQLFEIESQNQIGRRNVVKALETAQNFTLRHLSLGVAMNQCNVDPLMWRSISDDVCLTVKQVESEHPYAFDMVSMEKIEIVDSPYLILSFDARTALGDRDGAKLVIYADEGRSHVILELKEGIDCIILS